MHYPNEPQLIFKYNIAIFKNLKEISQILITGFFFIIFNCNYIKYNVRRQSRYADHVEEKNTDFF